jgi:hypothetical protein
MEGLKMTTSPVNASPSSAPLAAPPTAATLPRWPILLAAGALLALFVGGRLFAQPSPALFSVAIVAALLGAVARRPTGVDAGVRRLLRSAVAAHVAIAAGTGLFFIRAKSDGADDDLRNILWSLGLLFVVGGATLIALLESLMAQARPSGVVEPARVERAVRTAVTLLAAIGFLVGTTYAVHKRDVRFDLAYAAPSTPSGATRALLDTAVCGEAKEKPEFFLFFERGSGARAEVDDYFAALAGHGARVTTLDQAYDPALSKDLKVTKNGTIAVRCGARSESYALGVDRDEAQKKLPRLDTEMRTRLGKVSRDPVTVYFTVGHGERSFDENDKSGRASGKALKRLVEARNGKAKKLGVADGLSNRVPDDAGLVVVLGPTQPFLPEEARALTSFVDGGGAVALFLDPPAPGTNAETGADAAAASLQPVLVALGIDVGGHELVNDKEYVKQSGTMADHAFLFSTSFGAHKSVKTLSGYRGRAALLFQQAQKVTRRDGGSADAPKVAMIARSAAATWEDTTADRRFDGTSEKRGVLDFAGAVEKKVGDKEARGLVVGDADVVGDVLMTNEANAVFAWEALLWLLRDDDAPAGGVTVDEDVPLRHTRDEDTVVFYGTVLGAPTMLVVVGLVSVQLRRRRRSSDGMAPSGGAA